MVKLDGAKQQPPDQEECGVKKLPQRAEPTGNAEKA
jgi:hypothetical protein